MVAGNRTSLWLHLLAGGKIVAHDWIVTEVDHHLVSKVSDVLNRIHSLQSNSRKWESRISSGARTFGSLRKRIVDFCNQRWVVQRLGLHNLLLDQFVKGKEIGRLVLELAPSLCYIVLEGSDLSLDLFGEKTHGSL